MQHVRGVERREVRYGIGVLDEKMSLAQARRWGERNMPNDLRRAGFTVSVFASDPVIDGAPYFRVSFGMQIASGK